MEIIKDPKILCTIGMRGGSKGLPNKNERILFDKPLMKHTIDHAKDSKLFSHIVVSTDSDEIARMARSFGADAWFLRPDELATDESAKIPVIRHALFEAEKHYGETFDTIVDLDVTSPLRLVSDITSSYEKFIQEGAGNLFTVCPCRKNPYFNMVELNNGTVGLVKAVDGELTRRQDAPEVFEINAGVYIWKREILLVSDSLYNSDTAIYVMPPERSIDIYSVLDWQIVDSIMRKRSGGN